jgi:hypothetical protein
MVVGFNENGETFIERMVGFNVNEETLYGETLERERERGRFI